MNGAMTTRPSGSRISAGYLANLEVASASTSGRPLPVDVVSGMTMILKSGLTR